MKIIRLEKKSNFSKAYIHKSPIGDLILTADETYKYITSLEFNLNNIKVSSNNEEPSIIKQAKKELDDYFSNGLKKFSLPLAIYGTDFQYNVWMETSKIPFGKVVTYSDIARNISDKKGSISRAVGTAEGKNKIAIIIPCHRVVGVNKKLTGYAGGLDKKEYLLKLEGFNIVNSKIIIE
ncbi:methylated-DNA--[protein]-cysteine S-methyltransferase [Brachyspira hyodysenteriae]|uniref:methylated-DNA--[protein]-cysteine S-methyltransferase n=1 Tax=Brachyspira hyodysenteriae (strain ATCC 49526 / WA1) TaxID=565034 RepID=A0A3B6V844_BRAHW|nr:methylated-DNA--[protein]-cysteine S-methyltransferase [Brachyspira hyodysenteriae]ACN82712.1 methylated DNA-protein cysteine methyltransferase [Brachyspira hyodysenteriae WA1]KLI15317.1 cysteine methyltransferase [Brachyspira hyodysenteriae]KLI41745.1 cysteine methyltransferase [Brachyspira hyodysenteriae]KLI55796.1 cysteine methyltransferase [Brachyspira hyodysenteriae]MCZ9920779.1 methylated-DNA--[protein]-cysteine S-methyltransferase [Brachyspira hyodysenteriae]